MFLLKNLYQNLFYSDSLPCIGAKIISETRVYVGGWKGPSKVIFPIGHIHDHQRFFRFILSKKPGLDNLDLNTDGISLWILANYFIHLKFKFHIWKIMLIICILELCHRDCNLGSSWKNTWWINEPLKNVCKSLAESGLWWKKAVVDYYSFLLTQICKCSEKMLTCCTDINCILWKNKPYYNFT